MSASYRTCDNGCRGFFRSPRDRPNFQHIDAWQCPLSDEDDGFSSPRRRLHMTSQNYHLQRGSSRAYSASKAWHPSSPPRGYRGLGYRGRDRRRSEGRMDRASSFPRGRDYHNKLTQPVPNPRASRRHDPRFPSRSDADAISYSNRTTVGFEIKHIPANPDIKSLVTNLHAFIKASHHLIQFSRRTECSAPRAISKMVDTLSFMIKPAAPTPSTRLLIEGAAIAWGHSVCSILKSHYEDAVERCLEGLPDRLTNKWTEAFETAVRWTHRGLPRISEATIAAAKAQISAIFETERDQPHHLRGRARNPLTRKRYRATQDVPQKVVTGPVGTRDTSTERPTEDASGPPDPELAEASPEPPDSSSPSPVKGDPLDSSDSGDQSDGEQLENHCLVPGYSYMVTARPFTTRKRIPDHNHNSYSPTLLEEQQSTSV